jgi:hypothetical protein
VRAGLNFQKYAQGASLRASLSGVIDFLHSLSQAPSTLGMRLKVRNIVYLPLEFSFIQFIPLFVVIFFYVVNKSDLYLE